MTEASSNAGRLLTASRAEVRRLLFVALALLLVVAAGTSALFIVQGVDSQVRDVQSTYEVRRQARELVQALTDAETGQRGYLLTRDPAYLEPYRTAVTALDATYRNLAQMVKGKPEQARRVAEVNAVIESKRNEMATTITLATNDRLNEALSIVRSNRGRAAMDTIRETMGALIAEEDARLIERNALVDGSRLWLITMIIAALGGAAILTFLLFTRSEREVRALLRASNLLQSQNVELEARVKERTAALEEARAHAERERARVEALLQDTNHRIGNSLATVSSMLGLQVGRTRSEEVRSALEAAQNRVHSIASGHRRLRLGADMETTNAADFLAAVVEDLQQTQAGGRSISVETTVDPLVINARDATTIAIVVGELVINALKHAFPDGASGTKNTRLTRAEEGATLVVEDDGRGIAPEATGADTGLGAMIIRQLAMQFGGEPLYEAREGGGTRVTVPLPKLQVVAAATN